MSKGGTYENEIANKLSLWFTDGKRDDIFGRSDGSGGRFTSRRKKGKDTANMAGDLTFTDVEGEPLIKIWNLELKTGYSGKKKLKDADGDVIKIPVYSTKKGETDKIIKWKDKVTLTLWDVLDFVDSTQKKPVLQMMWEQCTRDADLTGRHPILIFRRSKRQSCICMKRSYYYSLGHYYGKCVANMVILDVTELNQTIVVMPLKGFFEWAQPVCKFLSE